MAPVTRQRAERRRQTLRERRRQTLRELGTGTIPVIDLTNNDTHAQHEAVAPEAIGLAAGTPEAATPEVVDLAAGTPEAATPEVVDLTADTPKATKSTACILGLTGDDSCYMMDDRPNFHSIFGAALGPRGYPAQDEVGDQEWWRFWVVDPVIDSMFPGQI